MADKQKTRNLKSEASPWEPQQPYIKQGWREAARLYKSGGPEYFPDSTVAPFSPAQLEAQRRGMSRAREGSPLNAAAGGYLSNVLRGDYLHSGDQDGKLYQSIANKVMPSVNSQFLSAGRYGSDSHAGRMTEAITDAYAPIAAQMYESERGRQQGAMGFAPTLAGEDWRDIGAMDAIGGQQQQLGQRELDDAVARWSYYQDLPYNKLAQYMGLIGGNYGGQTTSQTPYTKPGLFSTMLGGGMAGLGALGSFF